MSKLDNKQTVASTTACFSFCRGMRNNGHIGAFGRRLPRDGMSYVKVCHV